MNSGLIYLTIYWQLPQRIRAMPDVCCACRVANRRNSRSVAPQPRLIFERFDVVWQFCAAGAPDFDYFDVLEARKISEIFKDFLHTLKNLHTFTGRPARPRDESPTQNSYWNVCALIK